MNKTIPTDFLQRIPKTDLHLHLDGSLRIPTLIELAKRHRVKLPSYTEDGLRRLVFKDTYAHLPEYLQGFAYTCAVMQTAESLERIAFELAEDSTRQRVLSVSHKRPFAQRRLGPLGRVTAGEFAASLRELSHR